MAYWFCLTHHTVEGDAGCPNKDRLGPYDTEAEAGQALEKVAERNEAWDSDPRWNDDVPPDETGPDGSGAPGGPDQPRA